MLHEDVQFDVSLRQQLLHVWVGHSLALVTRHQHDHLRYASTEWVEGGHTEGLERVLGLGAVLSNVKAS